VNHHETHRKSLFIDCSIYFWHIWTVIDEPCLVSTQEGQGVARQIGAVAYIEWTFECPIVPKMPLVYWMLTIFEGNHVVTSAFQ
jgi:hypothetical protein